MKLAHLFIVFLIGVLLPITTLAEKSNLLQTLRNESNVDIIYNNINNIDWATENLDIIKSLWKKDTKSYPDLPWEKP